MADSLNNRILEFAAGVDGVFTAAQDGEAASVVLGQSRYHSENSRRRNYSG